MAKDEEVLILSVRVTDLPYILNNIYQTTYSLCIGITYNACRLDLSGFKLDSDGNRD